MPKLVIKIGVQFEKSQPHDVARCIVEFLCSQNKPTDGIKFNRELKTLTIPSMDQDTFNQIRSFLQDQIESTLNYGKESKVYFLAPKTNVEVTMQAIANWAEQNLAKKEEDLSQSTFFGHAAPVVNTEAKIEPAIVAKKQKHNVVLQQDQYYAFLLYKHNRDIQALEGNVKVICTSQELEQFKKFGVHNEKTHYGAQTEKTFAQPELKVLTAESIEKTEGLVLLQEVDGKKVYVSKSLEQAAKKAKERQGRKEVKDRLNEQNQAQQGLIASHISEAVSNPHLVVQEETVEDLSKSIIISSESFRDAEANSRAIVVCKPIEQYLEEERKRVEVEALRNITYPNIIVQYTIELPISKPQASKEQVESERNQMRRQDEIAERKRQAEAREMQEAIEQQRRLEEEAQRLAEKQPQPVQPQPVQPQPQRREL